MKADILVALFIIMFVLAGFANLVTYGDFDVLNAAVTGAMVVLFMVIIDILPFSGVDK